MDDILWRNFGKPKLSYELPDDEYEDLTESSRNDKKNGS
jgi:hypothetical protein